MRNRRAPQYLAAGLSTAFVIATALAITPVRLAALVLLGRSPHCPLRQAVRAESHARRLIETKDRILAASRLLEKDPEGFHLWQTPHGRYWIPEGADWGLPFNLAEQELKIYGTGDWAVRRGDIVLDCGAHVGVYTREALKAGARLVVAVEPAPENFECLRRNLQAEAAAGRVVLVGKGVWDSEGTMTIRLVPHNPAADTLVLQPPGARPGGQVALTTIDKLVAELGLARVDYIKMDIEGAEQRALLGAQQTLARFKPRLAISSYHRPDDPEKIPELVRRARPDYLQQCGPCSYVSESGIIRPDVLYFR
ncbi:MAG: FkbM family methyltransferase [Bryobacterales bacterium]|nr:FkbM family methyltransferase [Bryobacteraceae bacterium]MDW8353757.1 FkbM family methyltransferase [Bryobacterales bacterium]